jgi:hypothetical protein
MAEDHGRRNGRDPPIPMEPDPLPMLQPLTRPQIPELRRIRPGDSIEDVARKAASGLLAFSEHIPVIHKSDEETRNAVNMLGTWVRRLAAQLRQVASQVNDLHSRLVPVEQRPPAPSIHDVVAGVKDVVEDALEDAVEEIKTSPGIIPAIPPDAARKSDSDRVQKELERHDLMADGKRWRAMTKWWRGVAAGVAILVIGGALTLIWRMTVALEQAREAGILEGRAQSAQAAPATSSPPVVPLPFDPTTRPVVPSAMPEAGRHRP